MSRLPVCTISNNIVWVGTYFVTYVDDSIDDRP